ncbi:MAG: ACT domain-containing protein [Peptococcaceae bacterium]|jgi:ACT domain-containing protein|nr:ACT domain-containing protein [Peptococcaceae bacterium]
METKKVIITVIGEDRVGIIAAVAKALADQRVNILDISQTILGDFFTMMLIGDISQSRLGIRELQEALKALGEEIGMSIQAQHEDIFRFMHRV